MISDINLALYPRRGLDIPIFVAAFNGMPQAGITSPIYHHERQVFDIQSRDVLGVTS